MNNQCTVVIKQFVESVAALFVGFNDFHIHVFRHRFDSSYGCTAASHDHYILHVYIVFLTHNLANERYILASCHEISHVIEFQFIVTTRYNGVTVALDSHDMIGIIRATDVLERFVEYLTCLPKLDAQHH